MATNTEASMEEDSRTATFELKRPHDDSSNAGSTKSTPRKRARRSGRIGQQDVRDFVPHGASFSTSAAAIGEGEGGKDGGVSHDPDGETDHASLSAVIGNEADPGVVTSASGPPTQDEEDDTMKGVIDEGDDDIIDTVSVPEDSIQTQNARKVSTPAWNWNSVNTVRIRTSLGGAPGKSRTVKEGEVPTSQEYHASQTDQSVNNENMVKDEEIEASQENQTPQEQATQTAFTRLEGFRDRLSGMDPHDGPVSAYQAARVEMENAEVDYNYCLYYPSNEDFSPPPRNRAPQFVKRAKQWKKFCTWNQTKKCMKAGTLQDLKDGKIKVNAAELRRGDPSEPQPREMPSAALEDIKSPTYSEFPENFDSQKIQSFEIETASVRLKGLQESFSHTSEDGPSHRGLKEKLREAEGNLNYSQYFPSTQQYLPLSRAIAGLRNPNNSAGEQKAGNRRAAELLQFAQECAQVGKLEDLKVGQLDHRIGNVSTPAHSLSASASHAPPLENSSKTLGQPGLEVNVTGLEAGGKEDNTKALSPKTGVAESSHGLDGGYANNRKNSESDGGIILNTYNDSDMLSEGEISDLDQETDQMIEQIDRRMEEVYAAEKRLANENADEESDSDTDAESESDDGDALMDYSKSEPAGTDEMSNSEPSTRPKPKTARILAELSPQDLNTQLRYFHVTKSASQIDRKTPVRCLVCAQHGHMAEACKTLTCDVCGTFNHHITDNCPRTTKCSKCRESGHDKLHCPYKLKNMVSNEIKCDLCQRSGHIEEDCELVWRTSGRPWEFSLGGKNVRLSCYECGKSGHLGNDCPTRRPGKSPGTSTWGSGRNQTPQMSIKSKNEISIKGAARQDPISLDDEDGMDGQFVRPKVPEPASKGKIQIKASANSSFQNQGPNPAWDPINPRERPTQPTNNYYRNEDRGDWRAPNGPGQPASHENARYNDYRPIDRRSVSPEYRDRSGHARSDRYQAPAPQYQSRRPPPGGDVYRPMPSSAQNAWSRHRM